MEDNSDRKERKLRQCYHCNRFEDQLWMMAYEEILPQISKERIAKSDELTAEQFDLNRASMEYAKGA